MRNWKPRDYALAALLAAIGSAIAWVLPGWLWGGIAVVGFGASLWWSARQNRQREQQARELPPDWEPGKPPSPN